MNYAQQWVHEPQAADLLAIKQSTLRTMRRDGRLEAGAHWIYATGKARVRTRDDGRQSVSVKYPVFEGCAEAKDYIQSAKAGTPGANMPFGMYKVQEMNSREVNYFIKKFENSIPIGSEPGGYYKPKFTLVPYPRDPFDCGPNPVTRKFPLWY